MKTSKKISISVKTLLFCIIVVFLVFYIKFNFINKYIVVNANAKISNSLKNVEEFVDKEKVENLSDKEYELDLQENLSEIIEENEIENLDENNDLEEQTESEESIESEETLESEEQIEFEELKQTENKSDVESVKQQENDEIVNDDISKESEKIENLNEMSQIESEQAVNIKETLEENVFEENVWWKFTQYGDNIGAQMMNFSIEGNNHGLVLIDGGYENSIEQVEYIKNVIKQHNNQVDAWIITHLDSDHAGVFNNIYKNCPEIQINKIYTTNIPNLELAKEKAKWENDWKTYEDFCSFNLKNIQYLSEGDSVENLIGLRMKVLWSYSDWVYNNSTNLLNNGSLVFKLYGKEEDVLFCADTQDVKVGNQIIEKYKGILKSDYLQVGHHGNNSFSNEFYDLVSPKVAFFCAPDWLMNNEGNVSWFTVGKIRDLLQKKSTRIVSHNTSPNIISIK